MKAARIYHILARLGLGLLFLYTGAVHTADPAGLATAIHNYRILPEIMINISAVIMPWVEIAVAVSLISGIWLAGGSLIVAILMVLFTLALGASLVRGLDIACGCFTTAPDAAKITWWYLLRDLALLAVAVSVFWLEVVKDSARPTEKDVR